MDEINVANDSLWIMNGSINGSINTTAEPKPDWYYPLERAHTIMLTTILIFLMFSMGCAVEVSDTKEIAYTMQSLLTLHEISRTLLLIK